MKGFAFDRLQVRMGRLNKDDDLLKQLTEFCLKNEIRAGSLTGIGAVRKACLGYYQQDSGKYRELLLDQALEIASLCGNVSLKDDVPTLHCHIVLADEKGQCFGGHLLEGTKVFACEFVVLATEGGTMPSRQRDPATGLMLW